MLYTSYLNKLNDVPDDAYKLVITRFPPMWFKKWYVKNKKEATINKIYLVQELSPKKETLLDLLEPLNGSDWDDYVKAFNEQMETEKFQKALQLVVELLKREKDVVLFCCEKDNFQCHRRLIAEYIKEHYGYEWKEFGNVA